MSWIHLKALFGQQTTSFRDGDDLLNNIPSLIT